MPGDFNQDCRRRNDDFTGDRVRLPLGKHRDRAIVIFLARVVMNHLVQRGARRHGVQQQDDAHQQGGQGRFANLEEMAFYVLQIFCKLASGVPPARLIFDVKPDYFSATARQWRLPVELVFCI